MAPRVTQVRASPGKATEGPDGGTWEAGERVRRQVGTTLSSIVWSIREQAHGSGNRAESALRAVGGHRRSPSWLGLSANSGFLGVGRAGGLRRGRCKYVHVSSVAASMRLTPLRSPPARPRTGSCAASHERQKKKTKAKAGRCALQCLISDISWVPASGRHYRGAFTHGRRSRKSVGGGVVGASRTVGAMDGAIEPPRMGLRRVLLAPTTPPSHGNPAFAWAVAAAVVVALASAGAGRRPAKAIPLLPVQCRARFPTTVPRT